MNNEENTIVINRLPALLVGGPPKAGKSRLTYNLSQELRRREIQHYVFRASPDGEGDWSHEGDSDTVRQLRIEAKRKWSDDFRRLVSHDLRRRLVPLIVDLGGCPVEEDSSIFQACTRSLLLLKTDEEEESQKWRHIVARYGLTPLADLYSQREKGPSLPTAREPVLTGTITGMDGADPLTGRVYEILVSRICKLFSSYGDEELERLHMREAKGEKIVHLPKWLAKNAPGQDVWSPDLLEPLLADLPGQTSYGVYGRAPNWVYGVLALHGGIQKPFYQFDPRHGWIEPPPLSASASPQSVQETILLETRANENAWMLIVLLKYGYIDYTEADRLTFPEPPSGSGVIINGKLPLWLFTALARFYAARNVPWVALNYAQTNKAFLIYSQDETHTIGEEIPLPV
jgi:CRISPR-associated protein Csx3